MKKRVLTILISVLTVVTLCVIFSSCGEEKDCQHGGSHKWGAWETIQATCAKAGQRIRTCEVCGEEEEQTSYADRNPATGIHNYNSDGNCMVCGVNRCSIGNHAYGPYTITNPTCVNDEKKSRTCNLCGNEQIDESFIGRPATGVHDYDENFICKVCGEASPNKPNCTQGGNIHNWQESSRTEATCTRDGTITYTCKDCSKGKKTEIIEKAPGHVWGTVTMGVLQMERQCTVCGQKQAKQLKNLSGSATLNVEGGGWGTNAGDVNNGNWTSGGTAFSSTGSFELVLNGEEKVAQIAVACSSGSFKIEVITNKSSGEYIFFAAGAGEGNAKDKAQLFDVAQILEDDDVLISSVKVTQVTESYGGITWGEIAIGQENDNNPWQNIG